MRGAMNPAAGRAENVAGKIHAELEQRGLLGEPLGIDAVEPPVLFALQKLDIDVVDGQQLLQEARMIKTEDEITLLNEACMMVDAAYEELYRAMRPGFRENECVALVNKVLYDMGSEFVEGVNAISGERCSPHPHVFTDRALRPGGRRGSLSGIMTVRGVQGHVAYPLQSDNPIHALAKFVTAITREPIDAGNEHFPPTTFQMVNVHCDAGAPNVVPGELKCRFNFRYSNVWTHETLSARVEKLLKELGIEYELRWRVAGKPFLTKPGKLTAAVQTAVREATGLDPELSTSGGTSDGRFIAPYGVDVIELGPLNKTIHSVNERVAIDDLDRLEKIYFRIAELLLIP